MILLGRSFEKLLDTDQIIIQEINQNPERFLDLTIQEFANQANASISTISKFVRRIGFENYRSFQKYLNNGYSLQTTQASFLASLNLEQNDTYTLKNCNFLAINETIKMLDFEIFNQLVITIASSRKVWVIGQGSSFLAARDLSDALNNIGMTAFATSDVFGKVNQLSYLTHQDVLIFISEQFLQKEYQDLIIRLRKQKVKVGLITAVNKFFVHQKIDYVINFFAFSQENCPKLVGNVKIQQIFMNNLLINAVIKKKESSLDSQKPTRW